MPRVALLLEYRGTGYFGFQFQPGLPTIQGELEQALERLTGERCRVLAASRTDAGVHAWGQVASFRVGSRLEERAFITGLNHYLPRDIAVRAARRVGEDFRVRQARSREYCYTVLNRATPSPLLRDLACWVWPRLDAEAMARGARGLVGQHDFRAFAPPLGGRSPVRTVFQARVERHGEMVRFHIEAGSFLPQQVRRTVGALVEVGRGRLPVSEFQRLVDSPRAGAARPTAPPGGLCLMKVNYGEDLFHIETQDL